MYKTKITIAPNSGFCMGVKNAFDKSIDIGKMYSNCVILGDIVHNRFAIEKISESGLIVNENTESIIKSSNIKNVIIRAHGVPPSVIEQLEQSGKHIFDLTCGIVKKVQLLTKKLSDDGHDIIIFGKKNHPEVIGISGYCKTKFHIVSNAEEAKALNIDFIKPVLISQTTMNSVLFEIVSKILKDKYPDLLIHNTLCKNPLRTQESAIKLAKESDLMIVIGDRKSSNTISLYERVKEFTETVFIEDIDEISTATLKNKKNIGITGGSSTPEHQINKIKLFIENFINNTNGE